MFDEVNGKKVPYFLTRGSRSEAVLISYEEYCRFAERDEQELRENVDRRLVRLEVRNERYGDEEVAADIVIALAGSADLIVSGNTDLLTLDPFEGIPIVSPATFLARFDEVGT